MLNAAVARIYSEAIFLIALEKKSWEEINKSFEEAVAVFSSDSELKKVFISPVIPAKAKHNIIDGVFAFLQKDMRNLLHVLVNKHRERCLNDIYDGYLKLLDGREKIVNVEVYSSSALDAERVKKLSSALADMLKSKIKIEEKVYPDLIGGVVVKTQDRLIDGSLRNYIDQIKEKLIKS